MQIINQYIDYLKKCNKEYAKKYKTQLRSCCEGQRPKIAVLTCSDSRVIPEFIFNQSIGDIFVVRVAGNVAMDSSIISSLEYAVNNLGVKFLIILGHTCCGAVCECEKTTDCSVPLFNEIRKSFALDDDHILCNVLYQKEMIVKRSLIIDKAIKDNSLYLVGAIYNLETGLVKFL